MHEQTEKVHLQDRELSWLTFNRRVLEEAEDHTVPLLERLKFISIFTSNLDEFFMVRVGSLTSITCSRSDTASDERCISIENQMNAICEKVDMLYRDRDRVYTQVEMLLRKYGIAELTMEELTIEERSYTDEYFRRVIQPLLSPQIIDRHHPFPHIANKTVCIAVRLKRGQQDLLGVIPATSFLPRMIKIPIGEMRYLLLENILLYYADVLFERYEVAERVAFCITRSGVVVYEDILDHDETYSMYMKQMLKKRSRLAPVRLELSCEVSSSMKKHLCCHFRLSRRYLWISQTPLEMSYVKEIGDFIDPELRTQLSYPPFIPQIPAFCCPNRSIIDSIEENDRLLCYPYHTFDAFSRLMQEAVCEPKVVSIKITVYRLAAKESKLITYLTAAAEAGKEVTVLLELKARFDEQNNIEWAKRLEAAGCRVLFGIEGIKVHSKICLITRKNGDDIRYITHIGTGNYNEETSKLYTDISLLTADRRIGKDAVKFFQNMGIGNYCDVYEHLLVAPQGLRDRLIARIDREIMRVRERGRGRIILKMNAITDKIVIDKLCEASCAGVKIDLIVRGICCLLPNIKGMTENITVRSIVGRFLEHSRIYLFGYGEECDIYLSSADMMTRNTERRVEIACPVWDHTCKQIIIAMLDCMLRDNCKARQLSLDGSYKEINSGREIVDSQAVLIESAMQNDHQKKTVNNPIYLG